jgi:hypothetical protein
LLVDVGDTSEGDSPRVFPCGEGDPGFKLAAFSETVTFVKLVLLFLDHIVDVFER